MTIYLVDTNHPPAGPPVPRWRAQAAVGLRPTVLLAVTTVGFAILTAFIALDPDISFAYHDPDFRVALECVAAVVAFLAADLAFGRFLVRGSASDLLLALGLGILALSNLFFSAVPALVSDSPPGRFSTWSAVIGGCLGAAVFAFAPFFAEKKLPRRALWGIVALPALILGVAAITALLHSRLPWGVELQMPSGDSTSPKLIGHPVILGLQLGAMVAYAVAAVGFVRLAERLGDGFTRALALASVTAAFARLNYFLYPSFYSEWVYIGDAFRLLFYLLILLAVIREIGRYWQSFAQAAVLEERRRLARELHDGLAQELALLVRKGRRLAATHEAGREIAATAERALVESRRALAALTLPPDLALDEAVARAVSEVARNHRADVALDLETAQVPDVAQEALVRIASEAVINAVRHAHADRVLVRLTNGNGVRLEVTDDGVGFDPDRLRLVSAGFGLIAMRERAASVGAEFRCESRLGEGTTIEVLVA